jgi:hypothetical protein
VTYVLRFWWPGTPNSAAHRGGLWVAAVLVIIAVALAVTCPRPGLRRFLLWSLAMAALTSVLLIYYARTSVPALDIRTKAYLGYFYWAAPLVVAMVAAAGAVAYLDRRRSAWLALAAVVAGAAVIATVVPQYPDNPGDPPAKYFGVPQLPHVVSVLAAAAGGRTIVVRIAQGDWMHAVGVVAYADRVGVRSCVTGARYVVLFRAQSVCTRRELRTGVTFWFSSTPKRMPSGASVVASLSPPPATVVTRRPLTGK